MQKNVLKPWIIVRENAKERAQTIFDNTKIKIINDGQRLYDLVMSRTRLRVNPHSIVA